jgi:hypothetical protein
MAKSPEDWINDLNAQAIEDGVITAAFPKSDIGLLFAAFGTAAFELETYVDKSELNSSLVTVPLTEETILENLAAPFVSRSMKKSSYVIQRLVRTEGVGDIVIPQGTIFENPALNPEYYQSAEAKTMYVYQDVIDILLVSTNSGKDTMIGKNYLTVCQAIQGFDTYNPDVSWGGEDQESAWDLKQDALLARYSMEKGTQYAIKSALLNYGLAEEEYNLVEWEFGYGTFAVYVDTTVDKIVDEIQTLLDGVEAKGIYSVVKKITPVDFIFNFKIILSGFKDLLPEERNSLKADMEEAFKTFVSRNGVGQKYYQSQAIHYLLEELMAKYKLSDIHILTDDYPSKVDNNGNINIEDYEKINVQDVIINISVG